MVSSRPDLGRLQTPSSEIVATKVLFSNSIDNVLLQRSYVLQVKAVKRKRKRKSFLSTWEKLEENFASTCLIYRIGLHDLLSILQREEYVRCQSDAREEPEEQGKTAVAICPERALSLQMFICFPNPTLR